MDDVSLCRLDLSSKNVSAPSAVITVAAIAYGLCGSWLVDSGRPHVACRMFRVLDALRTSADKKTSLNNMKSSTIVSHLGKASSLFWWCLYDSVSLNV